MATYNGIKHARNGFKAKAKELRKQSVKTSFQAATFMNGQAKSLAPFDSGKTVRGIRKYKTKKGYRVESTVPGRFKQNLWANKTSPFRTLRFPKGGWISKSRSRFGRSVMAFKPGSVVTYGDGSHHTSGTPRFFHISTLRTHSKFKQLARANTLKALRVRL